MWVPVPSSYDGFCMAYTHVSVRVHRFIVPEDKIREFEETWQERESVMQQMSGFQGFSLEQTEGSNFVTTSRYACRPGWTCFAQVQQLLG